MYLTNKHLTKLFYQAQGTNHDVEFRTVSIRGDLLQEKGLFIPLLPDSANLLEAIHHGAISAIWDKSQPIPRYTPTDFPIFYSSNLLLDMFLLLQEYQGSLFEGTFDESKITEFLFLKEPISQIDDLSFEQSHLFVKDKQLLQCIREEKESHG